MIERHPITDRASWLNLRKQDITASVAASLVGCHDYISYYELYAQKAGLVAADSDETPAMRRGRLLEPVAMQLLREERPEWDIRPGREYFRDPYNRLGATPDCLAVRSGSLGVVQFKSTAASVFRSKWRDEETGDVMPPLAYVIQALIEADLVGAEWAAVAALTIGYGADLHLIEVPLHRPVIDRIREETRKFWARIDAKDAPDPDYARDSSLAAMLIRPEGSLDLSSDNHLPALLEERAELKGRIKTDEDRCAEIDAEIKAKIGAAAVAHLPGWRLTFKTVETKTYTVAARTTRPLKVNRIAEERKSA